MAKRDLELYKAYKTHPNKELFEKERDEIIERTPISKNDKWKYRFMNFIPVITSFIIFWLWSSKYSPFNNDFFWGFLFSWILIPIGLISIVMIFYVPFILVPGRIHKLKKSLCKEQINALQDKYQIYEDWLNVYDKPCGEFVGDDIFCSVTNEPISSEHWYFCCKEKCSNCDKYRSAVNRIDYPPDLSNQ